MRKVIKIFLSVVSWLAIAAVIVPLCVAMLLTLPSVQTFAVRQATEFLRRETGVVVSVDRVHIKFLSRVALDGVYVEDLNRDTLVYVKQLSVGITPATLLRGDMSVGKVRLTEPKLYLHQQADSVSNLKHLLQVFKREKSASPSGKPFRLNVSGVEITDMSFVHTKYLREQREYGVNFTDLDVKLHRLDVDRLRVDGDSISMKIRDIALVDKSGFSLERLSCDAFSVSGSGLRFAELEFDASGSHVEMDSLTLLYEKWVMEDFLNNVRFESSIKNSTVDFRTIAYFAPSLSTWNMIVTDLDATVEGPVADMQGRFENAIVGSTQLAASFALKGLPDVWATNFGLGMDKLETDAADVRAILADVAPAVKLNEATYARLSQLGRIRLKGNFSGRLDSFVSDAALFTGLGDAFFDVKLKPEGRRNSAVSGNLRVNRLDLGSLLHDENLGEVSFVAAIDGSLGKDDLRAETDLHITGFEFNGYDYRDIELKGSLENLLFKGDITSADPNIDFDFSGMLDFNDSIPHYDFNMALRNADFRELNFNKRDSVSLLGCRIDASASGATLDELNGNIEINDVTYISNADTIRTGAVSIKGRNSAASKNIDMTSDFADLEFRSRTSYRELFPQIEKMLQVYVPTLSPRHRTATAADSAAIAPAHASNYSILKLNVKETDNIAGALLPGLIIAKGTTLSLMLNPYTKKFSLDASSRYIEYNNNFASDIELNSRDEGDSLALYLRAGDLYVAGLYMPQFSINAGARDNVINASTHFANKRNGMSALLGITATMSRDSLDGKALTHIRLTPSSFTTDNHTWNIISRGITFGGGKIAVNNLMILGAGQSLTVDGVVSDQRTDTLKVRLSNFDLAPISQLTSTIGYEVRGKTSGTADMASAKKAGILHARIAFDSVVVNDTPVPSSVFESLWDFENERARFTITEKGRDVAAIRGYYRPAEQSYMAFLKTDGLDMALLDPFLEGVVSGTKGSANVDLEFTGTGRHLKTNGSITIPELTTKVDYLNVPYTLTDGKVEVRNNKFILNHAVLHDAEGNEGGMDLSVDLNNLKNVSYALNVRPGGMLVMNTTEADNDMFYGRMYASGTATIRGDRRATNISVNATTANSSEFYLPLSGKADALRTDLVVFKQPDRAYADSSDYLIRKRMIIERKNRQQQFADDSNMNIDLVLNVLPNALVEIVIDPKMGGLLRGRGNGSLTLKINPQSNAFTMYGDYQITEGVYILSLQDVFERSFAIEPGSNIQWTGDPVDALLNISAVYRLKASLAPLLDNQMSKNDGSGSLYRGTVPVECVLTMRERLSDPVMTFNISVPNVDPTTKSLVAGALNTQEMMATQFFSLLATRNFYRDTGQGMNIGSASGGTDQLVNILSSQLSNWLSNDRFNIGMSYRAQSEYNSDEFNVDFSTYLAGNRLLLEVEGNYDANNTPTLGTKNTNPLSGDFALTWLIDRTGNLRLKGFSRTVDRFDLDQGLQESGLGIYYREDFNTFSDILRNIRQRFSIFGRKKKPEVEAITDSNPENESEKGGKAVAEKAPAEALKGESESNGTENK